MPYLQINEKEFHPKTNFKFERLANEKYNEETNGEKIGGFMSVYLKLLQYDNEALLAFWDCALHHYKEKPTRNELEDALEAKIEEDADNAFAEAFTVLDQSGFFKKKVNTIWNEFGKSPKPKKNETPEQKKEREQQEQMAQEMLKRREELTLNK